MFFFSSPKIVFHPLYDGFASDVIFKNFKYTDNLIIGVESSRVRKNNLSCKVSEIICRLLEKKNQLQHTSL